MRSMCLTYRGLVHPTASLEKWMYSAYSHSTQYLECEDGNHDKSLYANLELEQRLTRMSLTPGPKTLWTFPAITSPGKYMFVHCTGPNTADGMATRIHSISIGSYAIALSS